MKILEETIMIMEDYGKFYLHLVDTDLSCSELHLVFVRKLTYGIVASMLSAVRHH